MKKKLIIGALLLASVSLNAQLGKNLEAKMNGTATDEVNALPKGFEVYDAVHTDEVGISGKYYTKYPVQLLYTTTMGGNKTFSMDQVTIEFLPETHGGRFHFIKDESAKMVRNGAVDLSTVIDFYNAGADNIGKGVAKKYSFYAFEVNGNAYLRGSVMGISKRGGFVDGRIYRSTEDPDVLLIGKAYSDGSIVVDGDYGLGGCFNVLSKNKEKLAEWDSTRIANTLVEYTKLYTDYASSAYGDMIVMPDQAVNDDAREKEYYSIIMPKASEDKPKAWGDKFIYCYVNTDWKVIKDASGAITHRWCTVIAVSNGWTEGSEARYIPVIIKQNYDGTKYGDSYFGGFKGALVPISAETATSFKY